MCRQLTKDIVALTTMQPIASQIPKNQQFIQTINSASTDRKRGRSATRKRINSDSSTESLTKTDIPETPSPFKQLSNINKEDRDDNIDVSKYISSSTSSTGSLRRTAPSGRRLIRQYF